MARYSNLFRCEQAARGEPVLGKGVPSLQTLDNLAMDRLCQACGHCDGAFLFPQHRECQRKPEVLLSSRKKEE
eukprot:1159527-Pelagomonas_calceolata.AAC.8